MANKRKEKSCITKESGLNQSYRYQVLYTVSLCFGTKIDVLVQPSPAIYILHGPNIQEGTPLPKGSLSKPLSILFVVLAIYNFGLNLNKRLSGCA